MNRGILLGMLILVLTASCSEIRVPSEEAMTEVFTSSESHNLIEPPPPPDIPVLAVAELSNWQALCDQCHVGPHYSSYTILTWGHLDSCIADLACTACHAEELHLTHVRGDKAMCYECHLDMDVPIKCENCHTPGCQSAYTNHDQQFIMHHGRETLWQDIECLTCHGSESWCTECHGLPMPHPEDIIQAHQELVQGQPERCANCHGRMSCIRCHEQEGVTIDLELTETMP